MVLTGAYTGLRPGELIALRIDRLDILRRQLRVEEPLKTPSSRRAVSFPPFLAEELAERLATYPETTAARSPTPRAGCLIPPPGAVGTGIRLSMPAWVDPCDPTT
jgi:integrase